MAVLIVDEGQMTKEHLRAVRDASPFQPFTIYLADGRKLEINHRDFLILPPEGAGRTAVVYHPPNGRTMSLVDLLLVTEVEVPAPAAGTNGQPHA